MRNSLTILLNAIFFFNTTILGKNLTSPSSFCPCVLDACGRLFGHEVYGGGIFFHVSSRFICCNFGTEPSSISNVLNYSVESPSIPISIGSSYRSCLVPLFISIMVVTSSIISNIMKLVRLWRILEREKCDIKLSILLFI